MKIMLVCRSFPPRISGRSAHCYDLAVVLRDVGHEVTVITQYKERGVKTGFNDGKPHQIDNVKIIGVEENGNEDEDVKKLIQTIEYESSIEKPDVIHAHAVYPPAYAALKGAGQTIPVITHVHGGDGRRLAVCCSYHRERSQWTLENSSSIIYVSESFKNEIENLHGKQFENSKVILNPIFTNRFKDATQKIELEKDKFNILFHGRIVEHKGIGVLIKAMRLLKKSNENVKLYVSGTGKYEEEARKLVKESNLENEVIFLGPIDYEEVQNVYKGMDLYCLPTEYEGCGLTILEAMASGLPILSTSTVGVVDIINDKENGMLVEINDIEGLARILIELVEDKELREKLALAGQRWVEKWQDWDKIINLIVNIYEKAEVKIDEDFVLIQEPDLQCPHRINPATL